MEVDLSEFRIIAPGTRCQSGIAISELSEERQAKVRAALAAGIPSRAIAERVSEWSNVRTSSQSIARHRKGLCLCGQ